MSRASPLKDITQADMLPVSPGTEEHEFEAQDLMLRAVYAG
jgi:hypothetical protein